jgi:hypothetical protein
MALMIAGCGRLGCVHSGVYQLVKVKPDHGIRLLVTNVTVEDLRPFYKKRTSEILLIRVCLVLNVERNRRRIWRANLLHQDQSAHAVTNAVDEVYQIARLHLPIIGQLKEGEIPQQGLRLKIRANGSCVRQQPRSQHQPRRGVHANHVEVGTQLGPNSCCGRV